MEGGEFDDCGWGWTRDRVFLAHGVLIVGRTCRLILALHTDSDIKP